jgi:hypothetical protein
MTRASSVGTAVPNPKLRGAYFMEKKSLISMLKTTKKVNVITAPVKNEGGTSRKMLVRMATSRRKRTVN